MAKKSDSNDKGPLRQWASPSYHPETGRAVRSSLGPDGANISIEVDNGRSLSTQGSRQIAAAHGTPGKGSPSWREVDQNRTTPKGHSGTNRWGGSTVR
jgi:hypothetical protein